jgi:hypothetical protein
MSIILQGKMIHAILEYARPIEALRLKHLIEGNQDQQIFDELFKYQNPDGGFGHGLEPDFWNPNSSPIQTWTAMTILRKIDFNLDDPKVTLMFSYLEQTIDPETLSWPYAIPTNDQYPHAPWWKYRNEEASYNPTASIAGFVLKYANPIHPLFRLSNKICRQAIDFIIERKEPIEVHELRCLIDMMNDVKDLYQTYPPYKKAKAKIILLMDDCIEHDTNLWFSSYVAKPSSLIKVHPGIGSDAYFEWMTEEFERAMKHTNDEGIWNPTFSWGNPDADRIWKAIIAIEYLELMKQFGFLA